MKQQIGLLLWGVHCTTSQRTTSAGGQTLASLSSHGSPPSYADSMRFALLVHGLVAVQDYKHVGK